VRTTTSRLLLPLLVLLGLVAGAPAASAAPAGKAVPAPALSLSTASGLSGATPTVTGRGFPGRTAGSVTVGSSAYAVTTDATGGFGRTVVVTGAPGPVTVTATVKGAVARTTFTVTATHPLRFGVGTPGGPTAGAELDQVAAVAGEQPGTVLSYTDFTHDLDRAGLDAVAARGATPLVTWEPWVAGAGTAQPAYSLKAIAGGAFDAYLTRSGAALAAFGGPVQLRFAHEMNGDWYPWSEQVNGGAAGDYVAAWRHVHDVVTAAGATNVSWVWSPNVPYAGSLPLAGLYPGAGYVDVVALDGYNWGTSQTWSTWQNPSELFGPGLAALRSLAPGTPVEIAETASAEAGGSKADWCRALVAYLDAQPDVTGFVWFDHAKETDWRIDSSAASAGALATALAARR
jgi:hypothetical protein